jgi:hypothetical protein
MTRQRATALTCGVPNMDVSVASAAREQALRQRLQRPDVAAMGRREVRFAGGGGDNDVAPL